MTDGEDGGIQRDRGGAFRGRNDATPIFALKFLRKVSVLLLPMLAVAATTPVACAENIIGTISSVKGTVKIVRDGKTLPATNGMTIEVHDKVVTLAGGSVTIVTPDHSALHLDQSGSVSIDESKFMNNSIAPSKSDCSAPPCVHTLWVP
jgi:hypothetical protein